MKYFGLAIIFVACKAPTYNPPIPANDAGKPTLAYETSKEEQEDLELTKLPKIEVHFSPKGGCTDTVDTFITSSKKELDIMAYSFTSLKIITAIGTKSDTDAGKSIPVTAILDRSDIVTPIIEQLENEHVIVYIDEKHAIMHNKFIVMDANSKNANDPIVWTGSCNLTSYQINSDVNNIIIIQDIPVG